MYYIRNGIGKKWTWLAVLFCIFGGLAAFGIGNATQVNSIAEAISTAIDSLGGNTAATQLTFLGSTFKLSYLIVGIVVAIIVAIVIIGGIKVIGQVTEKIVPFMVILMYKGTPTGASVGHSTSYVIVCDAMTHNRSARNGTRSITIRQNHETHIL